MIDEIIWWNYYELELLELMEMNSTINNTCWKMTSTSIILAGNNLDITNTCQKKISASIILVENDLCINNHHMSHHNAQKSMQISNVTIRQRQWYWYEAIISELIIYDRFSWVSIDIVHENPDIWSASYLINVLWWTQYFWLIYLTLAIIIHVI